MVVGGFGGDDKGGEHEIDGILKPVVFRLIHIDHNT